MAGAPGRCFSVASKGRSTAQTFSANSKWPAALGCLPSAWLCAGLPATPASDVFSFGLTLAEMLTGRRAHTEQSPVKLLVRLGTEDLASELVRDVDDAYQGLVMPMLSRVANQRPSMSEVVRMLNAFVVS